MILYWTVLFEWRTAHGNADAAVHMFISHEAAKNQADRFAAFCKTQKSKCRVTVSGPFYRNGV